MSSPPVAKKQQPFLLHYQLNINRYSCQYFWVATNFLALHDNCNPMDVVLMTQTFKGKKCSRNYPKCFSLSWLLYGFLIVNQI